MISEEMCNQIIFQYYDTVFDYCLKRLKGTQDAEDCTQEVFLVFFKKRMFLFIQSNLKVWLLKTADNVIKSYKRKYGHKYANIDDYSETLPDNTSISIDPLCEIEKYISHDDAELLRQYLMCTTKHERAALAERYNLNLNSLATRIYRIRRKIHYELGK